MTVDHVALALARIPEQHREQPNVVALITIFARQAQAIEDAMQQLLTLRSVDTATGEALEDIGAKVGQPRNGVADDSLYRRYIRARIRTSRSRGTVADLLAVSRLVIAPDAASFTLERQNTATVVLRVDDVATSDAVADILISYLRDATAAGVRVILESSTAVPGETFTFDEPSGSARGFSEGILVAVNSVFSVFREDVSVANEPVTVASGQYSHAEMVTLIDGQLLGALTFDIVAGVARFGYLPNLMSITWGAATGLRDALGFTGNAVDWDTTTLGPFIAPNPVNATGVGGTLTDART